MTSLEMRNLIFEALAEKNPEKTPWKKTFEMYGYRGTVSALRALVEYIGIEHGVIEKVVEIPTMAWGVPDHIGVRPHEIHIKKIKQNQKFYKRNIKYLVKAYHK